jgi:hypothetical protein
MIFSKFASCYSVLHSLNGSTQKHPKLPAKFKTRKKLPFLRYHPKKPLKPVKRAVPLESLHVHCLLHPSKVCILNGHTIETLGGCTYE